MELIWEGIRLMALGMGVVALFLGLLVVAVHLMSRFALRFEEAPAPARSPVAKGSEIGEAELAAVIAAAVSRYRHEHS